jgi:hypothetical protein
MNPVRGLDFQVTTLEDVGRVLETVWGADADGLLLREADLSPAVFDLRSGLLGELFQKLTNNRVRAAFVVPDPARHGERFAELASEHARHNQIRFVTDETAGLAWLEGQR